MTLNNYVDLYDALVASLRNGDIDEEEFERKHTEIMDEYCYGDDKEYSV